MTKAQRIEAYIKECFETNNINIKEFFSYFDDGESSDICWTEEKGKRNMNAVNYASELLGITVDDILTRSDEARAKWGKKYPFVWKKRAFDHAYKRTFYGKGYDTMRMYEAIFDTKLDVPYPTRYNYQDVINRLIEQLKEIDKSLPGTFHPDAELLDMVIDTENFCEFEEIEETTLSFIDMLTNAKALFLKAVHQGLTAEEIMEYNFLTTVLGTRDRYYVRGYLRYNELMAVKELYAEINEDNFAEYVVFRKAELFKPWCCTGFIENRVLVEKYLVAFPAAKGLMRQFADRVSQFYCSFIWSDAKPEEPDEVEIEFGLVDVDENAPKQRSYLYVPKTKEELNGADEISDTLRSYCRPAKLGGIAIKSVVESTAQSVKHITYLMNKVHHNNFIDWHLSEQSGGGNDE